jgi:putative methyltransferase
MSPATAPAPGGPAHRGPEPGGPGSGAHSGRRTVFFVGLNNVPFLPLVGGQLRAYAEQDSAVRAAFSFADPVFLPDPPAQIAESIVDPDVLALSCYVWNFRRQMKVAKLVRERYPDVLVVAGGPHVPDRPDMFFAEFPWVDVLVHGEGEDAFRELLRERARQHPDYRRVPGVSVRRSRSAVPGLPPVRLPRSITIPSPYLLGHLDAAVRACRSRGLRFYALWETNRGCPYSCAFCDWGSATMSALRTFDDERLSGEIEWFGRNGVEDLFICDANFGILPRDEEIARILAEARSRYGAPRQIRVNFAKNSNERVLSISRTWHAADLLMGTTLSLQSTDQDVLEAIDRKNIGIANYRRLQRRYRVEGIPTYTELILGLPRENAHSFRQGVGSLLAAGNHDDIRVYDFVILPNAPINSPETIARYGLRTIPKRLYARGTGVPDDEAETVDMVVRTAAMPTDDLVDCFVFVALIQFLHNGCYTRYVAQHAAISHAIDYTRFYTGLQDHFLTSPDTVLGTMLARLRRLYRDYLQVPELPLANLVASQPDMATDLARYGVRRGWTVDHWGWLRLATDFTRFYAELPAYLGTLGLPVTGGSDQARVLAQVLRYQRDIVIRPDYDPRLGKTCSYDVDLPAYFRGEPLRDGAVRVEFLDTTMGANGRYPLVPGDLKAFANAAVGPSYPISRIRRYQHQLDVARIVHLDPAGPFRTDGVDIRTPTLR